MILKKHRIFLKLKLVTVLVMFLAMSFKHPFYLGVCDLKYNVSQKKIQGSVKLFTGDFEDALKKIYKQPIDLINTKDKEATKKIIADYFTKHFTLKLNKQLKNFTIIGFEKEDEAIFTFIEFENCSVPKTIEIENTLLYDYLKDQMNIVHFEFNDNKKSVKINNPDKKIEILF